MNTDIIYTGDAFDVLRDLPDESIHACVTDPPYGLAFMGRDWDDFEPREYQEWCEKWAREVKRVLKPGAHLLAFSGNRTHHRLFTGVEDAGFEIRDTITWHYGSGFPKALDVSKAIDKAEGAEREVVGYKDSDRPNRVGESSQSMGGGDYTRAKETAPATDAAERWDGFKTALKPATEYVVVARKPLSEGTVAENVQTHGTGALNIGECRVGTEEGFGWERTDIPENTNRPSRDERDEPDGRAMARHSDGDGERVEPEGRYPSNVVFDETEAERLDREVGELHGAGNVQESDIGEYDNTSYSAGVGKRNPNYHNDSGGPSRYFYTSKASKAERTLDGTIDNAHPTVKPADLMEWLVTLVTAEGQTVLDPFAGSGTTCRAAKDRLRQFVGIEKQAKWADVARVRVGLTPDDPSAVRDDDAQSGFEDWP